MSWGGAAFTFAGSSKMASARFIVSSLIAVLEKNCSKLVLASSWSRVRCAGLQDIFCFPQ
jgi:hypothetical protein